VRRCFLVLVDQHWTMIARRIIHAGMVAKGDRADAYDAGAPTPQTVS
jgi:hypothetical protein